MAYELDRELALKAGEVLTNVLSVDDEYYFAKGSVLLSKAFELDSIEWNDSLIMELGSIWDRNEYELYPLTQDILNNNLVSLPVMVITRMVKEYESNEDGEKFVRNREESKEIEKLVVAFYNPLYECQMYNGQLYVRASETLKSKVSSNPLLLSKLFELCPDLTKSSSLRTGMNQKERSKVTSELRESILKRDDYTCQICGAHGEGVRLEIDHIIPISKGGKTELNNLQCLCYDCNRKKGAKIL